MSAEAELQTYWDDLRQTSERPITRARHLDMGWEPPRRELIVSWAERLGQGGQCLLCVKGPSYTYRRVVYDWAGAPIPPAAWLAGGVLDWFTAWTLSRNLIQRLLDVEDFLVDEPLHSLIDQGFLFTELYQAIWEARFLHQEGGDPDELVGALNRWLTGESLTIQDRTALKKVHISRRPGSTREQYDMLLFLFTLAAQNGVERSAVVGYDGLEKALRGSPSARKTHLRDLLELVSVVERWSRMGSPVGVIVGLDPDHGTMRSLSRYNKKLGAKVRDGFVGVEPKGAA